MFSGRTKWKYWLENWSKSEGNSRKMIFFLYLQLFREQQSWTKLAEIGVENPVNSTNG